jgi:phytoene dehydrogenase-like protein
MPSASIAAARRRVDQSRRELRGALRHLEATLSRPSSLLAAAAAGAVVGFSLERLGGAGALARGLAAAALRHGVRRYVRYRTVQAGSPAEDPVHG